jgi:SPX domain protein involved in polyphosphate accumulation
MPRLEYKYYVSTNYLDSLRADMMPFLKYDPFSNIGGKLEYTVRSIYYDSWNLDTYYEKDAGLQNRNKYRIRGYNTLSDDSIVFLEVKRKENDLVSKNRAMLYYNDLDEFINSKNYSLIEKCNFNKGITDDAKTFLYHYYLHSLQPASLVTYEREAFACKFGTELRITFDKNVRTKTSESINELFTEDNLKPSFKDFFVLEVKFERIVPSWIPKVLNNYNIFRDSVSKYGTGMEKAINSYFIDPIKLRYAL